LRNRTRVQLVVSAFVGLLTLGLAAASLAAPRSSGISASARAELRSAAISVAARNGDAHPYDIEAVRTTHRKAERLLDPGSGELYVVPPSAPVYVVAMRGHFSCKYCSHPQGVNFGPAKVITLQFLDPHNLKNVVFGYSVPYPRLKKVGTPVRL
jgi:hypothetical protein